MIISVTVLFERMLIFGKNRINVIKLNDLARGSIYLTVFAVAKSLCYKTFTCGASVNIIAAESVFFETVKSVVNIDVIARFFGTQVFRKIGLTFEEKAFYDILMALRDQYNFEYGENKIVDGILVNDKCKALAKKIKEIIDTKSSFADWLNNQNVRNQLKFDIKVCLVKNGYPPQYSPEVFRKVMEQVENFEEHRG